MRPPSTLPATPPVFPLFRMARALVNPHHAHQRQTRCASSGAAVAEAPPTAAAAEAAAPAQQLLPASWPGLHPWRAADRDVRTVWGAKGPIPATAAAAAELGPGAAAVAAAEQAADAALLPASLAECARAVLLTEDPLGKAALTHRAWRAWCDGRLPLGTGERCWPARHMQPAAPPSCRLLLSIAWLHTCSPSVTPTPGWKCMLLPSLPPHLRRCRACPPAQRSRSWFRRGRSRPWTSRRCPRPCTCCTSERRQPPGVGGGALHQNSSWTALSKHSSAARGWARCGRSGCLQLMGVRARDPLSI